MDISGLFDAIVGITLIGILLALAIPVVIVVVLIRGRLGKVEIDMAEFQATPRALRREGD